VWRFPWGIWEAPRLQAKNRVQRLAVAAEVLCCWLSGGEVDVDEASGIDGDR
jgi:hypothetical protein